MWDKRKNCKTPEFPPEFFFSYIRPNRLIVGRLGRGVIKILSAAKHESWDGYALCRNSVVCLTFKCRRRRYYTEYCNILSAIRRFIWFGSLYLGRAGGSLRLVINTEQTKMNGTWLRGKYYSRARRKKDEISYGTIYVI